MTAENYHPWLHRFAVITAAISLLPIIVGALVTTLDAGMAFPDWPASDGHNMFAYPWLKSAGDKFVEHGHRLAGVLIGIVSIVLTVLVWKFEPRRWVRIAGTCVLLAVIVQGLLGGARVLADARIMALVHGNFAAWVFALVGAVALFTSRSWHKQASQIDLPAIDQLIPLAVITPLVIAGQYLLGGFVRHLGRGLYEHLGFAFVASLMIVITAVAAHRSRLRWLQSAGWLMLAIVGMQVMLGAAAWVTRFGFASTGYVAVQGSMIQTVMRTAHTVVGMLLFLAAVNLSLRIFRIHSLRSLAARKHAGMTSQLVSNSMAAKGGAV